MTIHRHMLEINNTQASLYIPDEDNHEVKFGLSSLFSQNPSLDKNQLNLLGSRRLIIEAHGSMIVDHSVNGHFNSGETEIRFFSNTGYFLLDGTTADALAAAPLSSFIKESGSDNMVPDHRLSGDYISSKCRPESYTDARDRTFLDTEIKRNINAGIKKWDENNKNDEYKIGATTAGVMRMRKYFHYKHDMNKNMNMNKFLSLAGSYSSGSARKLTTFGERPYNTLHIERGQIKLSELFQWLKRYKVKEIIVGCCRGTPGLDLDKASNSELVTNVKLWKRSYLSGELLEKVKADLECRMAIFKYQSPLNRLGIIKRDTLPEHLLKKNDITGKFVSMDAYNGYVYYESLLNYCLCIGNYKAALKVCLIVFKRIFYTTKCYQAMRLEMVQAIEDFETRSNLEATKMGIEPLVDNVFLDNINKVYYELLSLDNLELLAKDSILSKWCYIFSTLALGDYLKENQGNIDLSGNGANTFWWHVLFGKKACQIPEINISFPVCSVQELMAIGIDRSDEMYNWCQNSAKQLHTKRRHSISF